MPKMNPEKVEPHSVLLRFPKDLHQRLTDQAAEEGISTSTYALLLISGGLGFKRNTDVIDALAHRYERERRRTEARESEMPLIK